MSIKRVQAERIEREPETAPRSRIDKRESITVDKTDYVNMMLAMEEARNCSRDLWEQIKHFEKICGQSEARILNGIFGCEVTVIASGFREEAEKIGHALQRGLKGKAFKR